MELMICVDSDNRLAANADGPVFDGPNDEPIWSLVEVDEQEGIEDEDRDENMLTTCLGFGLTYQGAVDLADQLDLPGRIIGYGGRNITRRPRMEPLGSLHNRHKKRHRGHRPAN